MSGPKIKATLSADSTDFDKKMASAKKTITDVGGTIGKGLAIGVAAGAGALVGLAIAMKENIGLANVQEQAEAKLGATLKATGQAAGYNLDQLKGLAGGLQAVTTVGDETILNGMAILSTFKEIKGEAFEGATKAALDMSQVMGQDLNSSMVQIGKALNDPIKGLTALSRVGVSFTEQQKKQIRTLQESGNVMGAQKIILQELQSEFGGAAEAAANTFGGRIKQLSNSFGDLKEEVGFTITKTGEFSAFAVEARLAIEGLTGWVSTHREDIGNWFLSGIEKSVYLVKGIQYVHNGFNGLVVAGQTIVNAWAYVFDFMLNGLGKWLSPIQLIFKGLEKIGAIEKNPFDGLAASAKMFKEVSGEVLDEQISKMKSTNAAYNEISLSIEGFIGRVKEKAAAMGTDTTATNTNRAAVDGDSEALNLNTGLLANNTAAKKAAKDATDAFTTAIQNSAIMLGAEAMAYEMSTEGMYGYKTAMQLAYEETAEMYGLVADLTPEQDALTVSTNGLAASYDGLAESAAGAAEAIDAVGSGSGGGSGSSGGGGSEYGAPVDYEPGVGLVISPVGIASGHSSAQRTTNNNVSINVSQQLSRSDVVAIADELRRKGWRS